MDHLPAASATSWHASAYDDLPLPHVAWGEGVRRRLGPLPGGARVLDAGCGTGRDAEALLEAHPGTTVVGLDADAAMLDRARERLAPYHDRVHLVHGDLAGDLDAADLGGPVDAVTSVAALHWVLDVDALAATLARVIRPGGRLVLECGGGGQLAAVERVLADLGEPPKSDVVFRTPDELSGALARVGLDVADARLRPHPVRLDDLDVLTRYLAVVVLRLHAAALPEPGRLPWARRVAERLPDRTVDYVRLEVEAVRST